MQISAHEIDHENIKHFQPLSRKRRRAPRSRSDMRIASANLGSREVRIFQFGLDWPGSSAEVETSLVDDPQSRKSKKTARLPMVIQIGCVVGPQRSSSWFDRDLPRGEATGHPRDS